MAKNGIRQVGVVKEGEIFIAFSPDRRELTATVGTTADQAVNRLTINNAEHFNGHHITTVSFKALPADVARPEHKLEASVR